MIYPSFWIQLLSHYLEAEVNSERLPWHCEWLRPATSSSKPDNTRSCYSMRRHRSSTKIVANTFSTSFARIRRSS